MIYRMNILFCGWAGDWLVLRQLGRLVVRLSVRLVVIVDDNGFAIHTYSLI